MNGQGAGVLDAISPFLFEVVQGLEDHLNGKVFEREAVDGPMMEPGRKSEQHLAGVP